MWGQQAGYTIVEVTLFLAISGLLFTIAILATGNTIRSVRFSDSGKSLGAYIQKQYDNVLNGVNPRDNQVACSGGTVSIGTQKPGTSNCFLMGKLIVFKQNEYRLTTYNVLGTEPSDVDFGKSDEELIQDYSPQVVLTSGVDTYDIPWQAYVSGVKRLSDGAAANALALLRSPRSTRILPYTYQESGSTPSQNLLGNASIQSGKVTNYCITSADGFGSPVKLVVNEGANQQAAQVVFDAVAGDCDGS